MVISYDFRIGLCLSIFFWRLCPAAPATWGVRPCQKRSKCQACLPPRILCYRKDGCCSRQKPGRYNKPLAARWPTRMKALPPEMGIEQPCQRNKQHNTTVMILAIKCWFEIYQRLGFCDQTQGLPTRKNMYIGTGGVKLCCGATTNGLAKVERLKQHFFWGSTKGSTNPYLGYPPIKWDMEKSSMCRLIMINNG